MSLNAVRWALYDAPAAKPADRLVLACLADHASQDGAGNLPSTAAAARKLGTSVGAVERSLVQLAEAGAVELTSDGSRLAVARLNLAARKQQAGSGAR